MFDYIEIGTKVLFKLRQPGKYKKSKLYEGIYIDERIDQDIPGYNKYECRGDDSDYASPASISTHVTVNFTGTFITKARLPLDEHDYMEIVDYWYNGK